MPDELREELVSARDRLGSPGLDRGGSLAGFRWSAPARLHLTLCFLGSVPRAFVPPLGELLSEVARSHRVARVRGGSWIGLPRAARSRVLAVSFDDVDGELGRISRALSGGCSALGLSVDARPLLPHVTLGRHRRGIDLTTTLERLPPLTLSSELCRLELCESLRGPGLPRGRSEGYPVLAACELDGGSTPSGSAFERR